VDDILEVINQSHTSRYHPTRPAFPVSAGPKLRGSRGAKGWSRLRAFRGNGSLAISSPRRRSSAPFGPAFHTRGLPSAGDFSARVLATFGNSRRLSYHVLPISGNHKSMSRQKIQRSPPFRSARSPFYPVAQWPQRFLLWGSKGAPLLTNSLKSYISP
jgi:hypothetical protein